MAIPSLFEELSCFGNILDHAFVVIYFYVKANNEHKHMRA